jgi:thioredoxin reductase (NADPH)
MKLPNICIVGGGPAGMAAALQLQRYDLAPTLYEADKLGGLLRNANLVENYPGFPGGVSGRELVGLYRRQMEQFGVNVQNERISRILSTKRSFTLEFTQHVNECDILILATGTKPVRLPDELVSDDVLDLIRYEVVSLRELRDREVAVIGAGDGAFDYALQVAKQNDVVIYNRSTRIRALTPLIARVENHPHIEYQPNTVLQSIARAADDRIDLTWENEDASFSTSADMLLCALGRVPNYDCCSPEMLESLPQLQETGQLFIIGDLVNDRYRQTSIAIADGIRTAMQIWERLGQS